VASTRAHGANRLASNSLLEGLVFGARAGRAMTGPILQASLPSAVVKRADDSLITKETSSRADPSLSAFEVRRLMWKSVGLFREREGLQQAVHLLHEEETDLKRRLAEHVELDHEGWRRASIVTVAALIANAALRREESRGGHFRTDFPVRDDLEWKVHVSDVRPL
jgi:L-aspartate oxidase